MGKKKEVIESPKIGRKKLPEDDKKSRLNLYYNTGAIKKIGGEDAAKELCYAALDTAFSKKK